MEPDADVVGAVLIVSSLLFLMGASLAPEPSRVFSAPLVEHLQILGRNKQRWVLMNSLMIAATLATTVGLVLLALRLYSAGDQFRAISAATVYGFGAVQWSLALAFRQTALISAADGLLQDQPVPNWLEPLQRWTGLLYWIYMVAAYISIAGVGWSLVETQAVSGPIAWFAVGFGTIAAAGFVAGQPDTPVGPLFEPPFLVHVVPLVVGVALLT